MYRSKEEDSTYSDRVGPDSVMSSGGGHVVRHKATSSCYQSLLMSSTEPGCIGENREDEEEEEGKRGCCCSAEHQLDAREVMGEVEGGVESKTKGFRTFWEELKGDRLDLMLLLFLYTLQVILVLQLILWLKMHFLALNPLCLFLQEFFYSAFN